jgi:hypothetical protein
MGAGNLQRMLSDSDPRVRNSIRKIPTKSVCPSGNPFQIADAGHGERAAQDSSSALSASQTTQREPVASFASGARVVHIASYLAANSHPNQYGTVQAETLHLACEIPLHSRGLTI